MKDSYYKELERKFDNFSKWIFLGDFNAKLGRDDTFKQTTRNDSFNGISIDNGVRILKFATRKICQKYDVPTS
jgi:hypothetical protein